MGEVRTYQDRGWAWVVVFAAFVIHILCGGFIRAFALVYIKLRENFNSNAALTSWVGGTATAVRMFGGKFA